MVIPASQNPNPPDALASRGELLSDLEHSLNAAKDDGQLVAVIVLKLHRLRDLRIEFGYDEIDAVVEGFVERLSGCLRERDHLARINNDEFALVLPGLKNEAQPLMAINKIQRACGESIDINGSEIKLKQTFGTAIGPGDADDAENLLRCADVALREAQASNVASFRYCRERAEEQPNLLQLEMEFESAMNAGDLRSFYQPIVDIETEEFVGVEMLSRWPNSPLGDINPSDFIATAERSGLIKPLTAWCLNNGLRECAEWQATLPNVPVSINFSTMSLIDPHLPEIIQNALNLWGTDNGLLTVEVTESAIMANPSECLEILNKLHDIGVKIAVDDFGTGHSSLAYLKQLPVDVLKIDKSFVTKMIDSLADRRIVQTVVDLAHNFDLMVVAEGVEDEETLDTLTLMGCQRAQGYHVARPMPADELEGWFRESPWVLVEPPSAPSS